MLRDFEWCDEASGFIMINLFILDSEIFQSIGFLDSSERIISVLALIKTEILFKI